MKILAVTLVSLLLLFSCKEADKPKEQDNNNIMAEANKNEKLQHKENIYQFKVKTLMGDEFDFATLKGKKILVVNTASKCGYTPQYEQLQALYEKYKDNNFVIVGFPANNFNEQEPGTNAEIAQFCKANYGVTFPMMAKISVKGEDMAPIYKFLTQKEKNGVKDSEVKWNFQKYLIDENGCLAEVYLSKTVPLDDKIVNRIEN
ncbi:MAG: glutathione peroxidase [Flavobacteriales bacterium]|nr:MAG: glutathione peroxidase [Flavobacteriales bacterium]